MTIDVPRQQAAEVRDLFSEMPQPTEHLPIPPLRLRRIYLRGVGPDGARFDPLDLDFSTRDGAASRVLLSLTNTGGKSTLITLVSSLVVPASRSQVGGKNLGDFVLTGDTSHIVCEWEDAATQARTVTGTVMEWKDGRRQPGHKQRSTINMHRAWYLFRTGPGLPSIDDLPFVVDGRRKTLELFLSAITDLMSQYPKAQWVRLVRRRAGAARVRPGANLRLRVGQQMCHRGGIAGRTGLGQASDGTDDRGRLRDRLAMVQQRVSASTASGIPRDGAHQRRCIVEMDGDLVHLSGPGQAGQRHHAHLRAKAAGQTLQDRQSAGPHRFAADSFGRVGPDPDVLIGLGERYKLLYAPPPVRQAHVEHQPALITMGRSDELLAKGHRCRCQRGRQLSPGEPATQPRIHQQSHPDSGGHHGGWAIGEQQGQPGACPVANPLDPVGGTDHEERDDFGGRHGQHLPH